MNTTTLERVLERSLELCLQEMGDHGAPPDHAAEITRRRRVDGVVAGDPTTTEPTHRRAGSPWLAAALIVLAIGATTWIHRLTTAVAPLATGPVVFVLDGTDLRAIDPRNGKEYWRFAVTKGDYGMPSVYGGVVYLGARGGHLLAINAATGKLGWRRQIGGGGYAFDGRKGVTIHDGRILCAMERTDKKPGGRVAAVDAKTGGVLWSFDADRPFDRPVVADGHVYAMCGDGHLYALELAKGTEVWTLDLKLDEANTPVVHGGLIYVSGDGGLLAIAGGKVLWERKLTNGGPLSAPVVVGDRVVVGGSRLSALSPSGQLLWQSTGLSPRPRLAVSGDLIVVADTLRDGKIGRLSVFLAKNGTPRWKRTLAGGPARGLSILDGDVYLVSARRLLAFRVEDSLPKWKFQLEAATSGPCVTILKDAPPEKRGK